MYGAKGLTEATPLSVMYRMARAARLYDEPDASHIVSVGRLVLNQYKNGERFDFSSGSTSKSKSKI